MPDSTATVAHTALLTEILERWPDAMNPNTHKEGLEYEEEGRGIRKMQPEEFHQDTSLTKISDYILACIGKPRTENTFMTHSGKGRKAFFAKGAMGKGKTRLYVELCKGKLLQKDLGHAVNFVRVTGGEGFRPVVNLRECELVRFAKALLQFHGIDVSDLQHVTSLADMDYLLREKLMAVGVMPPYESGTKQVLVICVDELLQLMASEKDNIHFFVNQVMKYQESTERGEKPTIFMFTTLTTEQGQNHTMCSWRQLYYYVVPTVPEGKLRAAAEDLVPNFAKLYEESGAFRQLFHIGVHNAGYIIDGFCSLDFTAVDQEVDKTNTDFDSLFEKAMDRSDLSVAIIEKHVVENWISHVDIGDSDDAGEALQERNLMYRDADSRWCLSPLLLRRWALDNLQDKLGAALNNIFIADRSVQLHDGAPMESVIMNLEVATRIAWKSHGYDQGRPLFDWFPGGMIKKINYLREAESRFPMEGIEADTKMTDDITKVEAALLKGSHVNPDHDREQGIDYLAPLWMAGKPRRPPAVLAYQHSNQKSLMDASKNDKTERDAYIRVVGDILNAPIVKALSDKGYKILPVLFTTTHADETIRNEATGEPAKELVQQLDKLCPEGWVVFDYKGTLQFTHRLGSMRRAILKPDTNGNDMWLPTGSLLASRLVWRTTPSRVSHTPNHMWHTQPPPFGARMAAYVPFLRRLSKLI